MGSNVFESVSYFNEWNCKGKPWRGGTDKAPIAKIIVKISIQTTPHPDGILDCKNNIQIKEIKKGPLKTG